MGKSKKMTPREIKEKILSETGISVSLAVIEEYKTINKIYRNLTELRMRRPNSIRIVDKRKFVELVTKGFSGIDESLASLTAEIAAKKRGEISHIENQWLRMFLRYIKDDVRIYDPIYDDFEFSDLELPNFDVIEDSTTSEQVIVDSQDGESQEASLSEVSLEPEIEDDEAVAASILDEFKGDMQGLEQAQIDEISKNILNYIREQKSDDGKDWSKVLKVLVLKWISAIMKEEQEKPRELFTHTINITSSDMEESLFEKIAGQVRELFNELTAKNVSEGEIKAQIYDMVMNLINNANISDLEAEISIFADQSLYEMGYIVPQELVIGAEGITRDSIEFEMPVIETEIQDQEIDDENNRRESPNIEETVDRRAETPRREADSRRDAGNIKKDENREKIKDIINAFGLGWKKGNLERMLNEDGFGNKSNITTEMVIEYILKNGDKFYLRNIEQARKSISNLSFGLGEYKEQFIKTFLLDKTLGKRVNKEINTFRGNKEEDDFINTLLSKGIYVAFNKPVSVAVPPLVDMKSFVAYLKKGGNEIALHPVGLDFHKKFGDDILAIPDVEKEILANISNNVFNNKTIKTDDIRKFEGTLGVKIYAYNGNTGGRITRAMLIADILAGKVILKAHDIPQMKRGMRNMTDPKLREIFQRLIEEREQAIQEAIAKRDAIRTVADEKPEAKPIESSDPASKPGTESIPKPAPTPADTHKDFDIVTDQEQKFIDMFVKIQNTYGTEHAIQAMKDYIEDGRADLFPPIKEQIMYRASVDSKATREALVGSFVKRVLRRMRDKDLGNTPSIIENYLEAIIVEKYSAEVKGHDDKYMIDELTQALCEFMEKGSTDKISKDSEFGQLLGPILSKEQICNILLESEISSLATKKDKDDHPLLADDPLYEATRAMDNSVRKIETKENVFVHRMEKRYVNSDDVAQSTLGANLYSSLSQNGRAENERIASMVMQYRELTQTVNILRNRRIELRKKMIAEGLDETSVEFEQIIQLEEVIKRESAKCEKILTTVDVKTQKTVGFLISDYESRVRTLKKFDEHAHSSSQTRYMQKNKRQEVIDI